MSRLLTLATAAAIVISVGVTWSYGDQAGGGGGGGGGAGGSGQAGGTGGTGTAGGTGQAGAAGQTGSTGGATSNAGAGGQVGAAGAAGATGQPGQGNIQGRANAQARGQAGITPQLNDTPNNVNDNFNNYGVGRRPFFADPNVRRQLNLNDQQFNRLNQSYQDAWGNFNQGMTGQNGNDTSTNQQGAQQNQQGAQQNQQRAQQMMQMQNRFNETFGRAVDSTFTDPRARNRFNQLSRQYQGPAAFNDPALRQQLNITPQQQRDFRRLSAEWRQQLQRLRRAGNDADPQVTQQQYAQLQQQFQEQMNAALTPQQQQSWQQIYGSPFVYPFNSYFDDVAPPTRENVTDDNSGTVVPRVGLGQQPATQTPQTQNQ